jgi:hypothetical protein
MKPSQPQEISAPDRCLSAPTLLASIASAGRRPHPQFASAGRRAHSSPSQVRLSSTHHLIRSIADWFSHSE